MSTIKDQLDLEKRMVSYGASRYHTSVQTALENERGSDTQFAQRLITATVQQVSDYIKADVQTKHAGRNGKFKVLLRKIDPDKAAFIGLKYLFDHFIVQKSIQSLGGRIGMAIEDELRFTQFHAQHKEYYNTIIQDFKAKGTISYRHKHRVLSVKSKEKGVVWQSWTQEERIGVGVRVLDCILASTTIAEKKNTTGIVRGKHRTEITISPTDETADWIKRFDRYAELLIPDRVPCIVEPDPWVSPTEGGYYTPVLRKRTPLVKTRDSAQVSLLETADLSLVMSTLNTLQATPWRVNAEVLDIMTEVWKSGNPTGLPSSEPLIIPGCPLNVAKADMTPEQKTVFEAWKAEARAMHSMERERVAKCLGVSRIIRMATEFKDRESIWYVYQCDFRGRIYSTVTGLSPQGPEYAKALLTFAKGKPLNESGTRWFKIHGAGAYGLDKESYADRIKWVDDNKDLLLHIAADPVSTQEHWAGADKPWTFIAWVLEYKRFIEQGDQFISHIPISLDGSCNGLQNFSAMLRDPVGARATNLIPGDKPEDIYREVARVLTDRIRSLPECPFRKMWLDLADKSEGTLRRSLAKRPVMTLPYGSTQHSCQDYILQYILEEAKDHFPKNKRFLAAVWLTPHLWESISQVVIAAREIMDWLQKCAGLLAHEGVPLIWTAPNGFPVVQARKQVEVRKVETQLCGRARLTVSVDTKRLDSRKQSQGVSPNFVHSMDASHLMMTVAAARDAGVENFAVIHDDFGTHAADTAKLQTAIRQAFIGLYTGYDPVEAFQRAHEESGVKLPAPPTRGNLDITQVAKSLYFFG